MEKPISNKRFHHQGHQEQRKANKFKKIVNPGLVFDFLGGLGALGGSNA
jgi:hypothetical protein